MSSESMADPFEELDAVVRALPSELRDAAHADIFADAVEVTGLEKCSLAMRMARGNLLERAFALPGGGTLNLSGSRAVLWSPGAPPHLQAAARDLARAAAAWVDRDPSAGALAITRDLRAGLGALGVDLARRWASRLARGDARILFRDEHRGAGIRISWSDSTGVRLEALFPGGRPSLPEIFSSVGIPGSAASRIEPGSGARMTSRVPHGRPMLEVFPGAIPEPILRRAFVELCRSVEHARSIHGDGFALGPLTPQFAWWTNGDMLVIPYVGFERMCRFIRSCRSDVVWFGPLSPEAVGRGRDAPGEPADVFYLAALFHRLVTGTARIAETSFEELRVMRDGPWPSLGGLTPAPLAETLAAALSPERKRPTLSQLRRALERPHA